MLRCAALISSLAFLPATHAQTVFDRRPQIIADPTPDRFSVCYGNTCAVVVSAALTAVDWQRVRAVLTDDNGSPESERAGIAAAIAMLESMVGKMTGTWRDLGGDVRGFLQPGQMDCVDEATNSTTYLRMMAQDGVLKWHTVEASVKRGHILFGIPHATALIVDTTTGERWAVDSWFLDNGEPPYILPYAIWKENWYPPAK